VKASEAGAARRSGAALVGSGPAEVDQETIAEILGDVTTETGDRRGRGALIFRRDLTPVFRIQMSGNLGRADEVREQHRQMTAFAVRRGSGSAWPSGEANLSSGFRRRR